MYETPAELEQLQRLLDDSAGAAGRHLLSIMTPERRLEAAALCDRLTGMRLIAVATVTADGRPIVGPVDGYFIHGAWYFGSARNSVRMRHLGARRSVSATYFDDGEVSVTVHGRAELFEVNGPDHPELRQAMLEHYLPLQGSAFAEWLGASAPLGARIEATKLFALEAPEAE